jgi:membrane-associated phospholipid phosphatase
MLDTSFVLWLQQWASPALTEIMRAVSLVGYVPSCVAIAIVCGFGGRLRLGVMLILAIVLADVMTVAAKVAFESPRPDAVDARVQPFGAFESGLPPMAGSSSVPADDFGFPSGHVATTAAWALGLALSRRRLWPLVVAVAGVALMALSRMYLGRHFPADVLGGLVVGVSALALAHRAISPSSGGISALTAGASTVVGVSVIVVVVLTTLSGAGFGAHDAGRFCGLLGATLLSIHTRALDESASPATRIVRTATALVLLGVAVWSSTWTITMGPSLAMVSELAISAVLHASVLLVPALALGINRS